MIKGLHTFVSGLDATTHYGFIQRLIDKFGLHITFCEMFGVIND